MKDAILKVLEVSRGGAISLDDIYRKIGYTNLSFDDFMVVINELIEDKKIYCVNSNSGLYTLNPFKDGTYKILRNGKEIVICDGVEYEISNPKNITCMNGDKVLIRVTDFALNRASIKDIVDRCGIVAEVKTISGTRYALVNNEDKYKIDLDKSIVDGMLIGIKIDHNKSGKYYRATLDKIICHKNAPKVEERKILYANGFPVDFSELVKEELKNIPSEVLEEDLVNRRDLRNKMIFTIDGDDTKDIDDAISLDILDNGNYLLGVHIADVSHYSKEGSNIDLEARERGTSVYMPGVVSPMYDPTLSNGICSLNPGVDRLAISCMMEIDENANMVNFDIFKSVIHSNIQMTYKNVNSILDNGIIPLGYEEYADKLKEMKRLANILNKSRKDRGMLDFDSDEIKILVDENGKVLDIIGRLQGTGESLIEDFMLEANECVATYVYNMGLPFVYRVHDVPNDEKLKKVITVMKNYGVKIKTKINFNDERLIQKLLTELKDDPNYDIYSSMLLRCMAKASYKSNNFGHYGVGIKSFRDEAYTHFTSPIRRYPDTLVHRVLSMILSGDIEKLSGDEYKIIINDIANHSSEMELMADACEREANKMKMASYMKQYLNQEFDGKIFGFTNSGMFIRLNNYVEGRVAYSTMDDFYRYDPDMEILVGDRYKKVYRLGDKVRIKVVKSNPDLREIDFELVDKKMRVRK